jgi:hypothetical protein
MLALQVFAAQGSAYQFNEWNKSELWIWILEAGSGAVASFGVARLYDPLREDAGGGRAFVTTSWPAGYNVPLLFTPGHKDPANDGVRILSSAQHSNSIFLTGKKSLEAA